MMKFILRTIIISIFVLFACIVFLLTPSGLKFSARIASHFSSNKFTYQKISGVWIGPIELDNVKYVGKHRTILINRLILNWRPMSLLKKQFDVSQLNVDSLRIINHGEKQSLSADRMINMIQSARRIHFPFYILVHQAKFNDIQIQNADHTLIDHIQHVHFQAMITQDDWHAHFSGEAIKPHILQWQFHLDGTPANYHARFLMRGKNTDWNLQGIGNANALNINTTKTKLLQGDLKLQLHLDFKPTVNWTGDIIAALPDFTAQINSIGKNQNSMTHINLKYQTIRFQSTARYDGDWKINWNMQSPTLRAQGKFLGNLKQHHVITRMDFPSQTILIQAHGTDQLSAWQENMDQFNLVSKKRDRWTLLKPAQIRFDSTQISMTPFCLHADLARQVCLSGNWSSHQNWTMQLHGHDLPFIWLSELLESPVSFHGKFSVDGLLSGFGKIVQSGNLKLHISPGFLSFLGEKKIMRENFSGGDWQTTLQSGDLSSQFQFYLNTRNFLKIHLTLPHVDRHLFANVHQRIHGDIHLRLTQFNWFNALVPHAHIPQGKLTAHLILLDRWVKPSVQGTATFQNGALLLPRLNVALHDMVMTMTGEKHLLRFTLTADSQHQPITIQGQTDISDLSQFIFPTTLRIKTNNTLLFNTDEYKAYCTSDLSMKLNGSNIFLSGNIVIPSGLIQPHDFKMTTTLPENDIIYIGKAFNHPDTLWLVHSNVLIRLGNQVYLNAGGAKAKLAGELQLMGEPNQDAIATGQISVQKGTITIYGRKLMIEPHSYISYSHALLNNPTLSIRASKKIRTVNTLGGTAQNDLVVGVDVQGLLKAMKITFFSEPADNLSQADILSYLVLGYANTPNTAGNTDFLLRALSAFDISEQGIMGKENISTQIQKGLGLNELGVESETTLDEMGTPLNSRSAFVIGKKLAKHFYMRYSIGLLDPVSVFQLRYLLGKHWSIQTESSSLGNGADILYTINKN